MSAPISRAVYGMVSCHQPLMKCVICKQTNVIPGTVTVTIDRKSMTLVFKHVAARICPSCGEEYMNEDVAVRLLETAEQSARAGVQVDVREYTVA